MRQRTALLLSLLLSLLLCPILTVAFQFPKIQSGLSKIGKCNYIIANQTKFDVYEYLYFHYCKMISVPAISIILFTLLAGLMLHFLYRTTDKYFTEVLKRVGKTFRLSDDLVGLTLVPIGNGAPDLFTALAGTNISFLVVLTNSAVLLTITFGIVLLVSPKKSFVLSDKKQIQKEPFFRNAVHLLLAFLALGLFSETLFRRNSANSTVPIPVWIPIVMIVLYFGYLAIGIMSHLRKKKLRQSQQTSVQETGWNVEEERDEAKNVTPNLLDQLSQVCKEYFQPKQKLTLFLNILALPINLFTELLILPPAYNLHGPKSQIQHYQTVANPFVSIPFTFYTFDWFQEEKSFWIYLAIFASTFGFSLILGASFQTSQRTPKWPLLHLAWSFIMSVVCLYFSSSVLLRVMETLSIIISIPVIYVALLLSLGNSLGDMVTGACLVRKGNFPIVSTAIFASIIQNIMLIFAIALLKLKVIGEITRKEWTMSRFMSWYLVGLLVLIVPIVHLLGYRVTPKFGYVLFGIYALYLATVCTLEHVPL